MEEKNTGMKILIVILLIVMIAFCSLLFIYLKKDDGQNNKGDNSKQVNKVEEPSELSKKGYSKEEENLITGKLDEKQISLVISDKYDKEVLIKILNEKYFINANLDRYFEFKNKNEDKTISEIIKDVNSNIDYEFYTEQVPADTSKGILSIANKHYSLSEDFEGLDITYVDAKYSYYNSSFPLNKEAAEHLIEMWNDMKKEGLDFGVYSSYRSYNTQKKLYNGYAARDGYDLADTYSARPGNSEHQLGLAVDLRSRTMATDYYERTKEYEWMQENAYKYGFILRYELGQEYITGYQYEPWHYRYCGLECATYIHENKITFEEYYEYFVKEK